MDFQKYFLLPTGIKKLITEYNQNEISQYFNIIQTLIDDYKISFEHFINEKKYKNIYKSRLNIYLRKVLNDRQYNIFKKLKMIDEKFYNFDENYKLNKRMYNNYILINNNMMQGGVAYSHSLIKENNNIIFRQQLIKYFSDELQLENFYNYINNSLKLLNHLQTLINPEKFVKYQDFVYIKEIISKTKFIIFLMDFNSKDANFENIVEFQNYFYKQLKIFILINQYNLRNNI